MTAEAAANRQRNGRFGPGNNANPGGRPKMPPELWEMAKAETPGMFRRLLELSKHEDPHVQLKAIQLWIERFYGKPVQAIDDVSERPAIIVAEPMTTEQWLERFGPETEVMGHGD